MVDVSGPPDPAGLPWDVHTNSRGRVVRAVVLTWSAGLVLLAGCSGGTGAADVVGLATPTSGNAATTTMSAGMDMTSGSVPAGTASTLLDPAEFAAAMQEPGRVRIDVHIPFEGKLNAGDLMIPYNLIAERAADLPADHRTPLAVYCRSGNMSAIAAQTLAGMGYTDIVELRGGMQAWVASGRPLITTP